MPEQAGGASRRAGPNRAVEGRTTLSRQRGSSGVWKRGNRCPRSKFKPTDDQRQKVKALAGYGLPHEQIATVAGVGSAVTLRKYFHEELRLGPLEAQSNVTRTLFRLASSGRNPAATMFWMKTRAGWSEQGKVEEREAPSHIVWNIQEYQPPRSPEDQKLLDEALRRFQDNPVEPVHWEGDKGYEEDEEGEAPRRRRRYH